MLIVIFALATAGCMDPLHDYEECKKIEIARCDLRDSCRNDSEFQEHFSDFDRDTCVAYAKEHCRTREIGGGGIDWGDKHVEACIDAIRGVTCSSLRKSDDETEQLPACAFINRPPEDDVEDEDDAGTESDAG